VQLSRKSTQKWWVLIAVLTLAGCQKSDAPQPAVAVSGSDGDKISQPASSASESPPQVSDQDPKHPIYEFETSLGNFSVRLDGDKVPLTVYNFRNYVSRRHYDMTIFHMVVKSPVQIVMGGGYTADLREKKPQTPIRNEADMGAKNHRGTIAMARRLDDEDSANCQFFINVADNETLDYKSRSPKGYGYCVFGEVIAGMETIDRIANAPVHQADKFASLPVETVVIKTVRQIK
jgi:cyclophilin family peptidyl-prolyl cis-trans isomerase